MGKLLKILTLLAILYFIYYMVKRFFAHRKLRQQGQPIPAERFRPITLLSIIMVLVYGGYLLYYFAWR